GRGLPRGGRGRPARDERAQQRLHDHRLHARERRRPVHDRAARRHLRRRHPGGARVRYYILAGLIAAAVTFAGSYLIWRLGARYRLYATIRDRDVHTTPTPRLGGVAMFLGIVVAMAFASQVSWFHLVFNDPGTVAA